MKVAIIGAGLAGSEAALVLARAGVAVDLYEMRPEVSTEAHQTHHAAELVCSNSFKSDELPTAHGLLKSELKLLQSPLMATAYNHRVPAGSALAVNRETYALDIDNQLNDSPHITRINKECSEVPLDAEFTIIATGPLTSPKMVEWLQNEVSAKQLNFYDAIAPIIDADSIDMDKAYMASRWGKGTSDYINCPFTREEYDVWYNALLEADEVKARDFEKEEFFEACLPIEVVARRGYDTLRFGMMKPVGLDHPETGQRYHAVCQLRKENKDATAYNMVGFQTRMTFGEQKKILRMIPGLENAEFLRYGTIHRNTYLNSPDILTTELCFKHRNNLFLAGQICGNEGYTESVATGHYVARVILNRIKNKTLLTPPTNETALGALVQYVTTPVLKKRGFAPTNINFSLIAGPPPTMRLKKAEKKVFYCERAIKVMQQWVDENIAD